jgi:crotonobetaine/carnitine-CoA ligase
MAAVSSFLLADHVARWAVESPNLDVLTFEHEGHAVVRSYRQLWDNARRLAGELQQRGMRSGDRFALLMANHPEFVEAMIAASITGTVFVPIDARTRGEKLAFMLRRASCRGALVADYALAGLASVAPLEWTLVLRSGEPVSESPELARSESLDALSDLPVPEVDLADRDPGAAWQVLFTSGTTGDPKGIVIDQRRYIATALLAKALCGYRSDDRLYTGLSLTHANAQTLTLGSALVHGLRAVISRRFTRSRLWDITRHFGCTTFTLLGGMTTAVYAAVPRSDDADNPVRFVLSAGMPSAIWADFERRFGVQILEFYGAAEGGLTLKPIGQGPIGSIGRPPATLRHRIVREDGGECGPNEPGELWFKNADGTPIRVEYLEDPEASARKCEGGWLHSGDVVRQDDDGWLYFEYRHGGGLRRNGEFIQPAAIEKSIAELPAVDDVYVYGVPARAGAPGEKDVVAAVVPADREAFDPQAVFAHCRTSLGASLVPSYVQVVAEIPKTASEKPQERFLVEWFEKHPSDVAIEIRQPERRTER